MRNKLTNLIVILAVFLSMSCRWSVTIHEDQQPNPESRVPEPGLSGTQIKPVQVTGIPSGEGKMVTAQTDAAGRVELSDPVTKDPRDILVKDAQTNAGISGITLTYVSDGADFIVFAVDPDGKYLPVVMDSAWITGTGTPKLARLKEQVGIGTIVIILKLVSLIQTVDDLIALYQHPPRLEKWGFLYEDTCWTGEQMGQTASVLTEFLPIPGLDDLGKAVFRNADQALLDMLKISQMGAEYEGQHRLMQFNGILRMRMFLTPIPIITPLGYCLDPLDAFNAQSVVDWVNYALEYNEIMPLDRLSASTMGYVNYLEGGQGITKSIFLRDMKKRLPAKPICEGYAENDRQIQIWISNWSPPLAMTELCWIECDPINPPWESQRAAFLFFKDETSGWLLQKLWLNEPDQFSQADGVGLIGCDHISPALLQVKQDLASTAPDVTCLGAVKPRLTVNEYAFVIPEPPIPNRVRSGPGREHKVIGEAGPGQAMSILAGPECSDGLAWWEVSVMGSGLRGWTVEGDSSGYWLAPCAALESCH